MAIDNQFGKGIGVAAGFDLGAQKPLDARVAVNTIAERDAHVTKNRAYEGMLVYVAEANMTYQLLKGEEEGQLVWKEFGFNQSDFDESFDGAIQAVDNRLKAVEADLAQGGGIETRIAQAESDIDGLQGLVGVPARDGQDASGLHAAVAAAQAKADQGVADAATEKSRAKGEEAAIRQEMTAAKTELQGKINAVDGNLTTAKESLKESIDDLADTLDLLTDGSATKEELASAREKLEEADERIEGLVTAEVTRATGEETAIRQELAKEKAALQAEIDSDVKVEKERATGQETAIRQELAKEKAALQAEIDTDVKVVADALANEKNVANEGSLAKKIADEIARADAAEKVNAQAVATEKSRAEGEEKRIEGLVTAEASKAREEERKLSQAIATEKSRAQGIEAGLQAAIDTLNGANTVDGSVAKSVKDAVDAEATLRSNADTALDNRLKAIETSVGQGGNLEARVAANEGAIEVINGTGEGSIKKAIADLIDGAPEATNTLNELADSIAANKGVYEGWVAQHEKDMAAMKSELQDEIDADVKVVADALAYEKNENEEGSLAKKIADEIARADAAEKTNAQAVATEKSRAQGIEAELQAAITKLNGADTVDGSVAKSVKDAKTELQGKINAVDGNLTTAKTELTASIGNLANALDSLTDDSATKIELAAAKSALDAEDDRIEGLVATEKSRAEGIEAGLQAAIDKLNDGATVDGSVAKSVKDAVDAEANLRSNADTALDGKITTLRQDMIAAINAIDLTWVDGTAPKIQVVLDPEQTGMDVTLGEVEVPVMTSTEVNAMLAELGLE